MKNNRLSNIIARIDSFPTLPSVVAQVLRIVSNPESTAKDLSKVIEPDLALTMSILRFANSAFFGLPKRVADLQHAVSIMGFDEIRNLVLGKAICQSFKTLEKNATFDIRKFWSHSLLSGLAGKTISADIRAESNAFFVTGLVHDIGKLLIYMVFPKEYCQVVSINKMGGAQLVEAETNTFGLSHDEVGLRLARRWLLPSNLVSAIGYHHRLEDAQEDPEFAVIIHVSDFLAHIVDVEEDESEVSSYIELFLDDQTTSILKSFGLELSAEKLRNYKETLEISKKENMALLEMLIN